VLLPLYFPPCASLVLLVSRLQDFSVQNDSDFPALGGAGDLGGDLDKGKVCVWVLASCWGCPCNVMC
jgi:hypothetical protein